MKYESHNEWNLPQIKPTKDMNLNYKNNLQNNKKGIKQVLMQLSFE